MLCRNCALTILFATGGVHVAALLFQSPLTTITTRSSKPIHKRMTARTGLDETSADGAFKRSDAAWRDTISKETGSTFSPEKGRYSLYVAHACPWAHRAMMVRALKGLEDVISVTVVMPTWQRTNPNDEHVGWVFADPNATSITNAAGLGGPFPASYPSNEADPIFNAKSIREIYEKVGDTDGKYSVPILFDKKLKTIVNNESSEIIRILNSQFNDFASFPDLELEPEDLKEAMASVDSWIYPCLNNGVYRCGFAQTQEAYDAAIDDVTEAFDRAEDILSKQRYIAGDRFTLSDVRLFVTLLRFDEVYAVYFKANTRSVAQSSVLLNYCRDIYQMPSVAGTVDMHQIKEHYYCSHPDLNKFSIVPRGPSFEHMLQAPHDRKLLDVESWRIEEDGKDRIAISDEDFDTSIDTL